MITDIWLFASLCLYLLPVFGNCIGGEPGGKDAKGNPMTQLNGNTATCEFLPSGAVAGKPNPEGSAITAALLMEYIRDKSSWDQNYPPWTKNADPKESPYEMEILHIIANSIGCQSRTER
jgi:hypothetical protein